VLPAEAKYKAKSFIDTVVYRGGDALSGWLKRGLDLLGEHPQLAMLIGAALALSWAGVGGWLGRRQRQLEQPAQALRAK
jgi:AAA family ATP:ADP antiporter